MAASIQGVKVSMSKTGASFVQYTSASGEAKFEGLGVGSWLLDCSKSGCTFEGLPTIVIISGQEEVDYIVRVWDGEETNVITSTTSDIFGNITE